MSPLTVQWQCFVTICVCALSGGGHTTGKHAKGILNRYNSKRGSAGIVRMSCVCLCACQECPDEGGRRVSFGGSGSACLWLKTGQNCLNSQSNKIWIALYRFIYICYKEMLRIFSLFKNKCYLRDHNISQAVLFSPLLLFCLVLSSPWAQHAAPWGMHLKQGGGGQQLCNFNCGNTILISVPSSSICPPHSCLASWVRAPEQPGTLTSFNAPRAKHHC